MAWMCKGCNSPIIFKIYTIGGTFNKNMELIIAPRYCDSRIEMSCHCDDETFYDEKSAKKYLAKHAKWEDYHVEV
jgi:hypothetical protein